MSLQFPSEDLSGKLLCGLLCLQWDHLSSNQWKMQQPGNAHGFYHTSGLEGPTFWDCLMVH